MTYLHTIKEFIMTIYHQSNITRFEEARNNARRAADIVLAVSFPKYCRAKVGWAKKGACLHEPVKKGEEVWNPKRYVHKVNITKGRGAEHSYVHMHNFFSPGLKTGREIDPPDSI